MRVLISTFGSRGDVEPVAALAAAVQAQGGEAVLCIPPDPEFEALADRAGATLAPAFTPVRKWIAGAMANDPPMSLPERAAWVLNAQFEALSAAAKGCRAVLATGLFPSSAAAMCVAELIGLPYRHAAYCPAYLPSDHHRPFPFPGHPVPAEITDSRLLWDQNIATMNALFGGAIGDLRARLGLPALDNVRDAVFTALPLLATDPVLAPWQSTSLSDCIQTGAWILPDDRPLPLVIETFLAAGPPPVFLGFGSMPMPTLKATAQMAIAAARANGQRLLLSAGWAGLELDDSGDDWLAIGEVNQQALFPRLAAVVHHGGAGTTHTAARAGAPQVLVPQVADQPYFASRVAALGVGVAHEDGVPTTASLTAALKVVLAPEVALRARALAGQINTDGAAVAAGLLLRAAA